MQRCWVEVYSICTAKLIDLNALTFVTFLLFSLLPFILQTSSYIILSHKKVSWSNAMIFSTPLAMASVMATMVRALPNRLFDRRGNTTSPDRDDLANLKPVDWHNLLQGSYGELTITAFVSVFKLTQRPICSITLRESRFQLHTQCRRPL